MNQQLSSRITTSTVATSSSTRMFNDLFDAEMLPEPATYSIELDKVMGGLETAAKAAAEVVEKRKEYVNQLQEVLKLNTAALESEIKMQTEIHERVERVRDTKEQVEEMILAAKEEEANADAFSAVDAAMEMDEAIVDTVDPVYRPLDEDTSEPENKAEAVDATEFKVEKSNGHDTVQTDDEDLHGSTTAGLEGLDPAVAQFLTTLVTNEQRAASGE